MTSRPLRRKRGQLQLPSELRSERLSKIDLDTVENKGYQPDETKLPLAGLKKVDIEAVKKKGYQAEETKLPAVRLKKVDIAALEKKERPAPTEFPSESSTKRLSKADIAAFENKVYEKLHESAELSNN